MNDELPSSLDNFFILSESAHIRVLLGGYCTIRECWYSVGSSSLVVCGQSREEKA